MADMPSIRIVKQFTYRGETQDFSNRYHFSGHTPVSDAEWTALLDAVTASEKAIFTNVVTIVSGVCYLPGSDVPVFSKAYSLAGTLTQLGNPVRVPGDVAALIRYSTTQRSVKNHPIYLYNYYHGVYRDRDDGPDDFKSDQRNAFLTYGQHWVDGFSASGQTYVRCGPRGAVAQARTVPTFLTHRDFPR